MFRIDIDALKDFTCVSPYFVRNEDYFKDDDCMCMMLYDEDMQPLSEIKTKEFTEALNNAVLDYCYDTPFKAEGNTLYAKWFVPIPMGDDTLEYSVMFILYMASLKAEHFKYNGIAVLAIEARKKGQQGALTEQKLNMVWHCLCVSNGESYYAETWMDIQQDKDGRRIYVNDKGEEVSLNDVAALLEEELDFEEPFLMDELLKKVLGKAHFE